MFDFLAEETGEPSAVSSSLNSIEKGRGIRQPANRCRTDLLSHGRTALLRSYEHQLLGQAQCTRSCSI